MALPRHTTPDLFGRPVGHENYGADPDSEFPDSRGPVDRPAAKKASKAKWETLIDEGFTNELGSPQETELLKEMVQKAPVETLYAFINNMDDRLRYSYLPPLVKLLQQRLKGTDLTIEEDFSLSFDKALGSSAKQTVQRTNV